MCLFVQQENLKVKLDPIRSLICSLEDAKVKFSIMMNKLDMTIRLYRKKAKNINLNIGLNVE